ncbi:MULTISPECIES: hypothetical protein [Pseudoalteromonas]|jgi:hypothetical protein|uniref:hypothetical protein n=1 Tax=Pseudoalteromonas TaxID=53246 RepID=UPI0003FAE19E|nr:MULTISPECIES: hypothetical protein [Pseudoalteromonas]
MFNFEESLKSGISHAEEEQQNRTEIDSVIEQLKSDIETFSSEKVSIKIDRRTDQNSLLAGAFATLYGNKTRKYMAMVAFNKSQPDNPDRELCEWKYGEKGYPVTIDYLNKSITCADKESLINTLQDLLSKPDAGKKIKFLLDGAQG